MERLALEGGTPVRTKPFPKWPFWDENDVEAVAEVVASGQWWRLEGTKVREFERAFAEYHHARYGVCVTNGTAALEVALRAAHIGCGDEVIVPAYTFIATATAPLTVGATPVFVDIDPHTFQIDPLAVEAAITPATRAVIPVHFGGGPADMDAILEIARRHDLVVIEDAAQAHGAEWRGRRVGAIGHMGCFSFQASKNLTAGEGGIVLTDDEELAEAVWSVHNIGRRRGGAWYEHYVLGGNFRMTEFQAALLLHQLIRLPEQTERRNHNALYLTKELQAIPGICPAYRDERVTSHAYHLYLFWYDPDAFGGHSRDEFLQALRAEGIPCSGGYGNPLHQEPLFRERWGLRELCRVGRHIEYAQLSLPHSERACREAVWLFQNLFLGDEWDMVDIVTAIDKIQKAWSR